MDIQRCTKDSFVVIGKEGSTHDGTDFVQKLWDDANAHFNEVATLAKKDEDGRILGIWGAMSRLDHSFLPWEKHFSQGLYLAGVECTDGADAPQGWTKWIVPAYEYVYAPSDDEHSFAAIISYLNENDLPLVGAVHDFTCPIDGKSYRFFPIRRLSE
ncbi:MAG: GyrI-like domain-containing protein [Clostridiales bacterium]|nr:GyrI-like domain-containing protein [Clostridiales bacterium]